MEPEDFRGKETQYQEVLEQERFFKKMTDEAKEEYMKDTLNFSMMMVSNGDADGLVAGSITSTSNVLHAAIRIVGVKPKSKWVSSSFFHDFSECGYGLYFCGLRGYSGTNK